MTERYDASIILALVVIPDADTKRDRAKRVRGLLVLQPWLRRSSRHRLPIRPAPPKTAARHLSGRRNRLRSGEGLRLLLGHRHRGDLRAAAHLRLPRAAGEARAEHRRERCRRSPTTARPTRSSSSRASISPTTRRSKGSKRELTADDYAYSHQALPRSEDPLAVRVPVRRQDRRARRAGGAGEEDRASSTTTRRSRASRRRIATRCASG